MLLSKNVQVLLILIVVLWTIPWKGVALWRAARNQDRRWFVLLLLINTLAILEILYIFIFSKKKEQEQDIHETRVRRII